MNMDDAVKQYSGKLLRYATSILHNRADAEDAVQDVFLAAFRHGEKFDGANPQAWLYKITYNTCMNKRRRRGFLFLADLKKEPAAQPQEATMLQLFAALSPLSPSDRSLLYMRIVEGYSYDELTEILGKSPAALRKAYMRAKNKAAILLRDYMEV